MQEQKSKYLGDDILEISLEKIESLLKAGYNISKRAIGLLLLQEDKWIISLVKDKESPDVYNQIDSVVTDTKLHYHQPINYIISLRRQEESSRIAREAIEHLPKTEIPFRERLSRIMMNPFTGTPILILILYWGIYKFVGEFGAGTVVDFIDTDIFENNINPWIMQVFNSIIPWEVIRGLFVGEYGIITLGVRYAVALILPIVTTFFIA